VPESWQQQGVQSGTVRPSLAEYKRGIEWQGGPHFYNKDVTIQPLKMDDHPTRRPVLERLARLMKQDVLTPIVADTYAFEDTARAHQEIRAGGHVGKLVVTP
jgi:NADPH2:quinone reductase